MEFYLPAQRRMILVLAVCLLLIASLLWKRTGKPFGFCPDGLMAYERRLRICDPQRGSQS